MKVAVFYGGGEVSKRAKLSEVKKRFEVEDRVTINLKEEGMERVVAESQSNSLFSSGQKLIIVENAADSTNLEVLEGLSAEVSLLIIAGNVRADSQILKSAKKIKATMVEFPSEKEITAFPFVDSLLERDKKAFVELQKLLSSFGGQYVLSMIFYGLRRNFQSLPPGGFMRQKVEKQRSLWSSEQLTDKYRETLLTDYRIKNGEFSEEFGLFRLCESFVSSSR